MRYDSSTRLVLEAATRRLSERACGVLVRHPLLDPALPETSDLDVLAFADIEDLQPERWDAPCGDAGRRSVDITWLPADWLDEPEQFAARGLIAHRLLTSEPLFWRGPSLADRCHAVRAAFFEPRVQSRRLAGFFEMASLTVREIGITWDFPALASFWLHMAYAACLAAGIDGRGRLCPNVFTQPFSYTPDLGLDWADVLSAWKATLRLDQDPATIAAAVDRVHLTVASQFPEPDWPSSMRASTRLEYRYWIRTEEKRYRLAVAAEMTRSGSPDAAVHYLRFYAYALARIPMVHARAAERRDVSFLRPEQAVLPDLRRLVPEILADLDLAFAGEPPSVDAVRGALDGLHAFRDRTMANLRARGMQVPSLPTWRPFERPAAPAEVETVCQT